MAVAKVAEAVEFTPVAEAFWAVADDPLPSAVALNCEASAPEPTAVLENPLAVEA